MAGPSADTYARFGAYNMVLPPEGCKVFSFKLDFTAGNTQQLDFTLAVQQGFITQIQGLFVDNSLNANPLFITTDQIGQVIEFPPFSQGYMPVFVSDSVKLKFVTVQAVALFVPVQVTNVPVQPQIWSVSTAGGGANVTAFQGGVWTFGQLPAALGPTTAANSLSIAPATNAIFTSLMVVPITTERSAALTGGDDTYATAGQCAKGVVIQNPVGNAAITVNIAGNSAATGIVIQAGGNYTDEVGFSTALHIKGTAAQSVVVFTKA